MLGHQQNIFGKLRRVRLTSAVLQAIKAFKKLALLRIARRWS